MSSESRVEEISNVKAKVEEEVKLDAKDEQQLAETSASMRETISSIAPIRMSLDPNTLSDAFLERKRKNYMEVKLWDENRIKIVRLHRSTVDMIIDTVDKKLRMSKLSLEVILKYFNDVVERESESIKFVKSRMTKVGNAYFNPENPKEAVYPKLSKALSVIDDASNSRLKYMEDFITFVTKTILKETLGGEIAEYEKAVQSFKQTLAALKKSLFKVNTEIASICAKFAKANDNATGKKKDVYGIQLLYFSLAQNHFAILRQIAVVAYEFHTKAIDLEKRRKDSVCKSFHLFLSKGNEIYGKSFLSEMTAKHFDALQMDSEVENHFEIKNFVTISVLSEISNATGTSINDTESLKNFLTTYEIKEITEKLLVLKQLNCSKDVGSITRSYKSVKAIATVDKNLLIVDKANPTDVKILNILDISKTKTAEKNDPLIIELQEKLPGIFYDSNTKVILKFDNLLNNPDMKMELILLLPFEILF